MNWQAIVEAIGIFAIGSGLLAWLIRSLVKQALDRDLEPFKHGLRRAHEIEMEEAKNRFTVGATSHMADVVFDKHVRFSEEYSRAAHEAMECFFRKGPTREIFQFEGNLLRIRTRWAVWLTPELEEKLDKFQQNLRTIGAYAPPREANEAPPIDVKKAFNAFADGVK
jgi:hypothetical protein